MRPSALMEARVARRLDSTGWPPAVSVRESAFNRRHRLYRSGEFFDLDKDPQEEQPLVVASLDGDAAVAPTLLQGVLDRFADARPHKLDLVPEQLREGEGKDRAATDTGDRSRLK
ncbi:MAG: hypothetical protein ABFE13_13195 [Phycisphaerales bacterium]